MPNTSVSHTPAPWRYESSTKTIRAVPKNYWLATMDSWEGSADHDANARLIAAAPELLDALRTLADHVCETYPHFESDRGRREIAAARDLIAKATGAA